VIGGGGIRQIYMQRTAGLLCSAAAAERWGSPIDNLSESILAFKLRDGASSRNCVDARLDVSKFRRISAIRFVATLAPVAGAAMRQRAAQRRLGERFWVRVNRPARAPRITLPQTNIRST
jgi:hypothetical protein